MKSPIKWAGGKGKLIEVIKSVLPPPSECQRLIEPFVGGANVFLNTEYKEYVLGDINWDLINLYRQIKSDSATVLDTIKRLWDLNNSEGYYEVRRKFNESNYRSTHTQSTRDAAVFIYLNRHAFNGLCRYNDSGEFNVPYGKYTNPYFPVEEISDMAYKLNTDNVNFVHDDFENTMRLATPGSAVICDPPYVPISATSSFTSYSKGGFDMPDQLRLAGLAEELSAKGVHIIIHNHDLPVTRELYRNADKIVEVNVQRNISCKGDNREKVKELIAVYKPK